MANFLNSVSAVALILMMVAIGYLFGRMGWMNGEGKKLILKIMMNVAVPCLSIKNLLGDISRDMLDNAPLLLLVALLSIGFTTVAGLLFAKLLKIGHRRYGGFVVMCAFSNSIFVGLPMCTQLFGDTSTPYVMLFYMVNTTLFWTLGEALIIKSSADAGMKLSIKDSVKKMCTPPLITLIVCMILLALNVRAPAFVLTLSGYMGGLVTPLALLYVGYVIYDTGFKNIRFGWDMAAVLFVRCVLAPASMIALFHLFDLGGAGDIARGTFIMESAMPVMAQSVVVTGSVGGDDAYNAVGMTITTLATFIAVPVLMLFV